MRVTALFLAGPLAFACAAPASAQAWLPPKGEASLTLGFSRNSAGHHINYLGEDVSPGGMEWHQFVPDLSYGVTDRLAIRLGAPPYVFSRYKGAAPHLALPGKPVYDDGTWHGAFQDMRAELRWKATTGSLVVTPLVAIVMPASDYARLGHSAHGRHLLEGQLGVSVGRLLDPMLPNAYVQGRYAYTVSERILDTMHDRSNASLDVGYLVTSSLTISALGAWRKSHGGWRANVDFPAPTHPNFIFHDQLQRTDYLRVGASVSYALTGSLDVSASWFRTVRARGDVDMSGLAGGVTYSFSPAQALKRKKSPRT
jgi:hypothetical protein